ncbi:MAG: hypothetical protein QOE68_2785 [Thermoanaerobaculia bacterium]|nr:hypothetical protein [Thermoanaerobaculia bacterium]
MHRILRIAAGLMLLVLPALFIVPHYLRVIDRSHQKRTLADMRTIATAWESRATDIDSYSVGVRRNSRGRTRAEQRVTTAELARALEPTYVRNLPRADGWGTEFQFVTSDEEVAGQAQTYMIRSLGSDRRSDRIANLTGSTTNFADDIVYSSGSFIRYPESAG